MTTYDFTLAGASLQAFGSGALFWPAQGLLCVSDLHLGKSERIARLGGSPLPPYETFDTLARLETDLTRTGARTLVCLGDSFDDLAAADGLSRDAKTWITRLQAGRRWIWIAGNHDAGPVDLGGSHLGELALTLLMFRHIAKPGAKGEISGHYHPKARLHARGVSASRPCFLLDKNRVILPAYGTYTGGLLKNNAILEGLMRPDAVAVLTGRVPQIVPMRQAG